MSKTIIKIAIALALLLAINIPEAIAQPSPECKDYSDIKDFARCEVVKRWDETQWDSFEVIIYKESSWIHTGSHNPKYSTAYGLGGFLNGTWKGTGYKKSSDPQIQILATIEYISDRYDTPDSGLKFHNKKGWY